MFALRQEVINSEAPVVASGGLTRRLNELWFLFFFGVASSRGVSASVFHSDKF